MATTVSVSRADDAFPAITQCAPRGIRNTVAQHTLKEKCETPEMARCAENGMERSCNLARHAPEGQTFCARVPSLFQVALLRRASIKFSPLKPL